MAIDYKTAIMTGGLIANYKDNPDFKHNFDQYGNRYIFKSRYRFKCQIKK